jgi:hypothetical protein
MDHDRFDTLLRLLATAPSRRRLLRGVVGGLGVSALTLDSAAAKRKRKKKKRKPKQAASAPPPSLVLNRFGCVEVGQPCRGDNGNCCSGVCQGAAPTAGQPDTSQCVAHDAQSCLPGQTPLKCGGVADLACTTVTGVPGQCATTTGNAGFCAANGTCFPCKKDADCQPFCTAPAACVPCTHCATQGKGETFCLYASPASDSCKYPVFPA